MFRVIYIDKNGYGHKGGFKSDKDANDWAAAQKKHRNNSYTLNGMERRYTML